MSLTDLMFQRRADFNPIEPKIHIPESNADHGRQPEGTHLTSFERDNFDAVARALEGAPLSASLDDLTSLNDTDDSEANDSAAEPFNQEPSALAAVTREEIAQIERETGIAAFEPAEIAAHNTRFKTLVASGIEEVCRRAEAAVAYANRIRGVLLDLTRRCDDLMTENDRLYQQNAALQKKVVAYEAAMSAIESGLSEKKALLHDLDTTTDMIRQTVKTALASETRTAVKPAPTGEHGYAPHPLRAQHPRTETTPYREAAE